MRVAVIGAGSAGLTAIKNCLAHLGSSEDDAGKISEVVCYERTDNIGGIWVYTPETGLDKYGLPVHSSMYNSLRTNLPKEVMRYPDFPFFEDSRSYMTRTEVLDFLNRYCDHFQLRPYIRFHHNVELVEPIVKAGAETKWRVTVKDLASGSTTTELFDGVMVCNGHYFQPNLPVIRGQDIFQGLQLHSHDYRVPDIFKDKTVVVLGAGPSGMDLALEISKTTKKVVLSHHSHGIQTIFPENVVQTNDVVKMDETAVFFEDGRIEKPEVIFYCTGYQYSFPFLAESCGVRVDSNMVTPLWKHLLSAENPTLAFIGLPFYVCAFSMCDLQARFALKFWLKEKKLPSKEDMLAEEAAELARKKEKGLSKRHFHMMGPDQGPYYEDLARTAGVTPIPPVLTKIHNDSSMRFDNDLVHYRDDRYKVIDDFNFVKL